jgi:hypothetical protein
MQMIEKTNLLGAVTTLAYFSSMILIFVLRLLGKIGVGARLGLIQTLIAIPLAAYLLLTSRQFERPVLYIIQVALFLAFLILELLVDFILKIEFRQVRWMVIIYVTFFFAAAGGMIGVASTAGLGWTIAAIILYLIMAILAFLQRAVTGI